MTGIFNDPRIEQAVTFAWETQRMLTDARFYGWSAARLKEHIKSRAQQWRRFSSGVRTAAHQIFMEQLHEQLGKHPDERDTTKPTWINEQFGVGIPVRTSDGDSSGNNATASGAN